MRVRTRGTGFLRFIPRLCSCRLPMPASGQLHGAAGERVAGGKGKDSMSKRSPVGVGLIVEYTIGQEAGAQCPGCQTLVPEGEVSPRGMAVCQKCDALLEFRGRLPTPAAIAVTASRDGMVLAATRVGWRPRTSRGGIR